MVRRTILLILLLLLPVQYASADWEHNFVVYSGDSYVVKEELVDPDNITEKIGVVTLYSDKEGS